MENQLDWIKGSEILKRWDMKPTDLFYVLVNHKMRIIDHIDNFVHLDLIDCYEEGNYKIDLIADEMFVRADFERLDEKYRDSMPKRINLIYGKQLMKRWGKHEAEMFKLIFAHGLTAVDRFGCPLEDTFVLRYMHIVPGSADDQIFLRSEIERFEAEYPELSSGEKGFSSEVRELILKSKNEIETIYSAIKNIGLTDNEPDKDKKWKQLAIRRYEQNPEQFEYIKKEFLEDKGVYAFTGSQSKRDFFGKMLQYIIKDHGLGSHGYQRLAKEYNQMID